VPHCLRWVFSRIPVPSGLASGSNRNQTLVYVFCLPDV
jgi:hypothetical protein